MQAQVDAVGQTERTNFSFPGVEVNLTRLARNYYYRYDCYIGLTSRLGRLSCQSGQNGHHDQIRRANLCKVSGFVCISMANVSPKWSHFAYHIQWK